MLVDFNILTSQYVLIKVQEKDWHSIVTWKLTFIFANVKA
jgi:hypothetical protein